ncbi:MAG: methyltransferase [Bacteroidetes bacterium]|nr:methyltransferase [Bacteroidota bacterium]
MTGKERIQTTLNHNEPDRVPLDFGGCAQTTIHVSVIAGLRDHFGLEKRLVKVDEPYTMMGKLDEDLKDALSVDVDAVPGFNTFFGMPRNEWKEYVMEDGLEVLVPENFNITRDDAGDIYTYPQGDISVPPSGKMPRGGYYFDAIIRQPPIDDDNLNVEDNLEEFAAMSEKELEWLKDQIKESESSGRATLAAAPGAGLGDIACVPGPWMKDPKGIRDIQEWYISTVLRTDYMHTLFEQQTEIAVGNLERMYAALGNKLDIIWVCGTDFGTQNSTFCSLDTFNELYKPYYQKINNWIHQKTEWETFKHCCGAVEGFMEGFIESGFDIINPVQWTADGMKPKLLKERYGDRITFWGGGVNTQATLPFGKPEQVREEVLRSCEVFAPGGGFVFNTIHNIQAGTPVANVVAMLDAFKEFNGN